MIALREAAILALLTNTLCLTIASRSGKPPHDAFYCQPRHLRQVAKRRRVRSNKEDRTLALDAIARLREARSNPL